MSMRGAHHAPQAQFMNEVQFMIAKQSNHARKGNSLSFALRMTSTHQSLWWGFGVNASTCKPCGISLLRHLHCKSCYAEHVVLELAECILSRFDVFANGYFENSPSACN